MLFSKAKALHYVIWSDKCSGDLYGITGMPRASALGTIGADAPIYPRHEGVLRLCHSEGAEQPKNLEALRFAQSDSWR